MAETAVPFAAATGTAMTTLQQYRDRLRPTQPDAVDGAYGSSALKVAFAGSTISVSNGGALVQGFRYDLTSGPMILTPAAAGAANIFGVVCLTLDTAHTPIVYLRIVSGTSGGGLPALTNSLTGVWDFPIAHFERQPGGTLVNLKDRRKFRDGNGGIIGNDDTSGTLNAGWFPPAPRTGSQMKFWPSQATFVWSGSVWSPQGAPGQPSVLTNINSTPITGGLPTSFSAGSPIVSLTMVAPPSGSIITTVWMRGVHNTAGEGVLCSFEVRVTNSSGSVFLAAADDRSVQAADHGPAYGGHADLWRHTVTGLTPGTTYYFRTMHRGTTTADATIARRYLYLESVK